MTDDRKLLVLPVVLRNPKRKADMSLTLSADTTKECSSEDLYELDKLITSGNTVGWWSFTPNSMQIPEMPKGDAKDKAKTPNELLYNALFVLWKYEAEEDGEDFEVFRRRNMENLRQFVLDRIREVKDAKGITE